MPLICNGLFDLQDRLFMVPADVATTSLPDGAIVTTIAARAPPAVTKPAINTNTERKRLTATSKQYR
jgi:hypothetical protein